MAAPYPPWGPATPIAGAPPPPAGTSPPRRWPPPAFPATTARGAGRGERSRSQRERPVEQLAERRRPLGPDGAEEAGRVTLDEPPRGDVGGDLDDDGRDRAERSDRRRLGDDADQDVGVLGRECA